MKTPHKGRGAQINPNNPYDKLQTELERDIQDLAEEPAGETEYITVYPKTILNKVTSPDIPADFSMNPYQGCEHGCVYCYARNTHPYWGYSAGLDFERKILIKQDAPKILEKKLQSPKWKATPIMFSGNTDCYQPAEQKYQLTRQMLEILWKYRHPVGLITKNKLILRDIDILEKMAAHNLVHVAISLTTLEEPLRRLLEPRTSSVLGRLDTIEKLSAKGIPVNVMAAPIIPGLNEHEIFSIAEETAKRGARSIGYTMVRLNGDVGEIFADWIERTYPDRKDKILNKIRSCHDGELNDSRFGKRMVGEGQIAESIQQQMRLAKKKFFEGKTTPPYNCDMHEGFKSAQMRLF
ncbi:MAG: PA0069 family radical SAM protein [Saprospirales bacterium]|nr:PA0069 family radical SAM protein [Saprospirales bacterium]